MSALVLFSAVRSDSMSSQSSTCDPTSLQRSSFNHSNSSLDRFAPASPRSVTSGNADARYHSSSDLTSRNDAAQSYTSAFKSDVFTCYSQPSSPAKARGSMSAHGGKTAATSGGGMHKAISMNDNLHRFVVSMHAEQVLSCCSVNYYKSLSSLCSNNYVHILMLSLCNFLENCM